MCPLSHRKQVIDFVKFDIPKPIMSFHFRYEHNCLEAALGYGEDVTVMGLVRVLPDNVHPDIVFENLV